MGSGGHRPKWWPIFVAGASPRAAPLRLPRSSGPPRRFAFSRRLASNRQRQVVGIVLAYRCAELLFRKPTPFGLPCESRRKVRPSRGPITPRLGAQMRSAYGLARIAVYLLTLRCGHVDAVVGAEFSDAAGDRSMEAGDAPVDVGTSDGTTDVEISDGPADGSPDELSDGSESGGATPPAVCEQASLGLLSGGFTIQVDSDASGQAYLLPPPEVTSLDIPGDASATYTFWLGEAATYLLFGRVRGAGVGSNSFWITVDTGASYLWHLSTGVAWFSGPVTSGTDYEHPIRYMLDAGNHQLVVQNAEPGVGLDRLCFAPPGYVPPDNDTPCNPPNSIQLAEGGCELSCGAAGGDTCGATVCAGTTLLPSYDCPVCCFVPDAGADGGGADAPTE
jgi:hypothetical protein